MAAGEDRDRVDPGVGDGLCKNIRIEIGGYSIDGTGSVEIEM